MPPAHAHHRPSTSPIRVSTCSNRAPEGVDESALTANALWEAVTGRPGQGWTESVRVIDRSEHAEAHRKAENDAYRGALHERTGKSTPACCLSRMLSRVSGAVFPVLGSVAVLATPKRLCVSGCSRAWSAVAVWSSRAGAVAGACCCGLFLVVVGAVVAGVGGVGGIAVWSGGVGFGLVAGRPGRVDAGVDARGYGTPSGSESFRGGGGAVPGSTAEGVARCRYCAFCGAAWPSGVSVRRRCCGGGCRVRVCWVRWVAAAGPAARPVSMECWVWVVEGSWVSGSSRSDQLVC